MMENWVENLRIKKQWVDFQPLKKLFSRSKYKIEGKIKSQIVLAEMEWKDVNMMVILF